MKHVCMFSGGASSSYMSFLIASKYPNDTILLHTPAGAEHPDADRFRAQVAEYIGLPITVASCGMTLWEVIKKNNCLPDFLPFCTRILKREPREKFLKTIGEHVCYVGFGPDEARRVENARSRGGKTNTRFSRLESRAMSANGLSGTSGKFVYLTRIRL